MDLYEAIYAEKKRAYIYIYTAKKMFIVRKGKIGNEMYIKGKKNHCIHSYKHDCPLQWAQPHLD